MSTTLPIKAYFLKKSRGRSISAWQRRWVVFSVMNNGTAVVSWWKTEKDELAGADKSCKGKIALDASVANIRSLSLKDYCLELADGKGETVIFAAYDSVTYNKVLQLYSILLSDIHAGTLWKRARKSGKNWRQRYICLNRKTKHLMIFDSQKKFEGVHKNGVAGLSSSCIDLTKCVAHESGLRQYGIEIIVPSEPSLYLAADSIDEQKKWLLELEQICGASSDLTKTMSARGKALFDAAMIKGVTDTF